MYGPVPTGERAPVTVVASVRRKYVQRRQILHTQVELYRHHQEETVARIQYPFSRRSWDDAGDRSVRIVPPPSPPMNLPRRCRRRSSIPGRNQYK